MRLVPLLTWCVPSRTMCAVDAGLTDDQLMDQILDLAQ
jgi:hypothetical protein